jgi:hypothetical protein
MNVEENVSSRWADLAAALGASTVTLAAGILTLVAVAHLSLRWWIRRKTRLAHATGSELPPTEMRRRHWTTRGLREILAPLALLVWIHGLYFAPSVLLEGMDSQPFAAPTLVALTWAYRLSVLGALCWLLARVGRLIEAVSSGHRSFPYPPHSPKWSETPRVLP